MISQTSDFAFQYTADCHRELSYGSGITKELIDSNTAIIISQEVDEDGYEALPGDAAENNIRNGLLKHGIQTAGTEKSLAYSQHDFKAILIFNSFDGSFASAKPHTPRPKFNTRPPTEDEVAADLVAKSKNLRNNYHPPTRYERTPSGFIKYEQQAGENAPLFIPTLPIRTQQNIRAKVAKNYPKRNLDGVCYWQLVEDYPKLFPVLVAEGAKKTLALASLGFIVVGTTSCTTGLEPKEYDDHGNMLDRYPLGRLHQFAKNREVGIFYDIESDAKKNRYVTAQGYALLRALRLAGASSKSYLAIWPSAAGKGIDDVIVGYGDKTSVANYVLDIAKTSLKQRRSDRVSTLKKQSSPSGLYSDTTGGYISDHVELHLGHLDLHAIISPTGSGKTTLVKRQIKDWVASGGRVLVITATNNLGKQVSEEISGTHRHDFYSINDARTHASSTGIMVCCPDSLRLVVNDYIDERKLLIFVDEVEQVMAHISGAETIGTKQCSVLDVFQKLFRQAASVIVAEADIPQRTFEFLAAVDDQRTIRKYRHSINTISRTVETISGDVSAYIAEILDRLGDGEKLVIPCDSQIAVRVLESMIASKYPELVGAVIHKDSAYLDQNKSLIAKPDKNLAELQLDYLIYSPCCKSGWSLNAEGYNFDRVMGLFRTLSVTEALQLMARFRGLCPWSIYIPDQISRKGMECHYSVNQVEEDQDYMATKIREYFDVIIDSKELPSLVQAANRHQIEAALQVGFEKSVARTLLDEMLLADGHRVSQLPHGKKNSEVAALYRKAKAGLERADAAALAAIRLTEGDDIKAAIKLESKEAPTPSDRFTAKKIRLTSLFEGCDFDDEIIAYHSTADYGKMTKSIERRIHMENPRTAFGRDSMALTDAMKPENAPLLHKLPKKYARALFALFFQLPEFFKPGQQFHNGSKPILGLHALLVSRSEEVKRFWGLNITNETRPISAFAMLARHFGVTLIRSTSKGRSEAKGGSIYTVATDDSFAEEIAKQEDLLEEIMLEELSGLSRKSPEKIAKKKERTFLKILSLRNKREYLSVWNLLYDSTAKLRDLA